MARALRLAARGLTPPNPMVGCVLVREGEVVGEGYHAAAGQPHAEAMALAAAGDRAAGAAAYVTLEPCSHYGRTPPCVEALIRAGVARVVAAARDPNPRVNGQGFDRLRAAGIDVAEGVMEDRARDLNEAFFHFHSAGLPLITMKAAMTLDGKIASRTGDSMWISGTAARRHVHALRARSGAVMVGIGTLLADDARLTARTATGLYPRQPLRIVVDSRMRTPVTSAAVREASEDPAGRPLMIACVRGADPSKADRLRDAGAQVEELPADATGRVDLHALARLLTARSVISVLCEGGGELSASLLAAALADRVLYFIAPRLLGGRDALTPLEGQGAACIEQSAHLDRMRLRRFGVDVAVEARILHSEQVHPCSLAS